MVVGLLLAGCGSSGSNITTTTSATTTTAGGTTTTSGGTTTTSGGTTTTSGGTTTTATPTSSTTTTTDHYRVYGSLTKPVGETIDETLVKLLEPAPPYTTLTSEALDFSGGETQVFSLPRQWIVGSTEILQIDHNNDGSTIASYNTYLTFESTQSLDLGSFSWFSISGEVSNYGGAKDVYVLLLKNFGEESTSAGYYTQSGADPLSYKIYFSNQHGYGNYTALAHDNLAFPSLVAGDWVGAYQMTATEEISASNWLIVLAASVEPVVISPASENVANIDFTFRELVTFESVVQTLEGTISYGGSSTEVRVTAVDLSGGDEYAFTIESVSVGSVDYVLEVSAEAGTTYILAAIDFSLDDEDPVPGNYAGAYGWAGTDPVSAEVVFDILGEEATLMTVAAETLTGLNFNMHLVTE